MDLQDNIFIIINNKTSIPLKFSDNELNTDSIVISENVNAQLIFNNMPDYRIYLDGLDLISGNIHNTGRIKTDSNDDLYIKSSDDPYIIYDNNINEFKYLPGRYLVKLVKEDLSNVFYSEIEIKPKFLNENDLQSIKIDIENTVKGLSRYFLSNKNGFFTNYSNELKYNDLKAIEVLSKRQNEFNDAIFSLIDKPRFEIVNYYHWTNKLTSPIDRKSLKHMSMYGNDSKKIYGKDRKISYNTRDNINLKNEIYYLYYKIQDLQKVSKLLYDSNTDKQSINMIKSYNSTISSFINQKWFKNINANHNSNSPLISNGHLDNRYAFFNSLVWELEHLSHFSNKFEKQYLYYWKRTDLLYEIWGYIKVIDALTNLGFNPIRGWIFDNISADYKGLDSDTEVILKSGKKQKREFFIKVIYDKKIKPKNKNMVTMNDPIWHGNQHNRPDILIEIYDSDNIFIKSIILDTKYRNINDVWRGPTNSQITAYKDSIFSPYPFCSNKYKIIESFNHKASETSAVISVGVIHPGTGSLDNDNSILKMKRSGIFSIEYNPSNNGYDLLKQFLDESFKDFEQTMDDYENIINYKPN